MAIQLRPINDSDLFISETNITQFVKGRNYGRESDLRETVVDPELFGVTLEHCLDSEFVYDDEYFRTQRISLYHPVLNFFLAGIHKSVWTILLGPLLGKEKRIERVTQIAMGEIAFCPETGEMVHTRNPKDWKHIPYDPEKWLFGGSLLLYYLNERFPGITDYCKYEDSDGYATFAESVNKVLKDEIYETFVWPTIAEYLGVSKTSEVVYMGKIIEKDYATAKTNDDMKGWLIDDYFWDPEDKIPADALEEVEADVTSITEKVLHGQFSNISIILAFKKNPRAVYDQIMNYIFVLPLGYRASIDDRVDPLTVQYNKLVKQNRALRECMEGGQRSLYHVLITYTEMVKIINTIFTGAFSRNLPDSYKSLEEQLSGKSGLMRDRMQGVRMDYSGRAVITCDPNMPIDTIGVPKKMIPKLKEIGVIKSFKAEMKDDNMSKMLKRENSKAYNKRAIELAKDDYFITGRQPTLWYLGVQGFKVRPVDSNSIVLSPLVVEPFNADFDGDQMHLESVVTKGAKEEVQNIMRSTNNLFYPRNGELTVAVRHEIQYGLWMATKVKDDPRARIWTAEELKELGKKMDEDIELRRKELKDKQDYEYEMKSIHKDNPKHKNRKPEEDTEKSCISDGGIMNIIYEGVCRQEIAIYDKVPLSKEFAYDCETNPMQCPAGVAAVKYAIGKTNSAYAIGVMPLTKYNETIRIQNKETHLFEEKAPVDKLLSPKWLKALINKNDVGSRQNFVDVINKVTKLGFAVVAIWPPSISAIVDIDVHSLIEEFNIKIAKREELLSAGIDTETSFTNFFNAEFKKLDSAVKKRVVAELGTDNGYVMLAESGAKGNKSNLAQIFGYKGRIQKNDVSSFNTIIGASLSDQLSALEHFIAAYGSRQGLADKVLATAEPGYLSRQLEHCAATARITVEDCGTTDGLVWTYDDVKPFIDAHRLTDDEADNIMAIEEFFSKFLIGRNIIDTNGATISIDNPKDAAGYFRKFVARTDATGKKVIKLEGIKVRSPLHCKCPTCQKCYGKDPTTNATVPIIGKPIGFVAAQAIGQPGTQLTMKNFQRGGVVSDANLTSSFDKINKYLELTDLRGNKSAKYLLPYDALAPGDGQVVCTSASNGRKRVIIVGANGRKYLSQTKIYVDKDTKLKSYVTCGESLQEVQGDLNMVEVLRYRGYEEACKYLILMLYKIFNDETDIWAIHFEVIVSCMASYIITNSTPEYNMGTVLSLFELRRLQARDVKLNGIMTLMGLKTLPKYRSDFFESMIMEDMKTFVPRAIVMNPVDEMKNPKTRISFGMDIGVGTAYKGEDWF